MKVKDFMLKNEAKILLNSINGGSLVYLPLYGRVNLITNQYLELESDSPYFNYYKNVFELPEIDLNKYEDLKKHITNLVLFDEFSAGDKKFFQELIKTGISIKYDSVKLNNKYYFQEMVSKILGSKHSTSPILIKKGAKISEIRLKVKEMLKQNEKILIKISDEYVAGIGADQIKIIKSLEDFTSFINKTFQSPEHESIRLVSYNKLGYDLILEPFFKHTSSPSVTYYFHEDGPEFLSINEQIISDGSFIGSTNILSKSSLQKQKELKKLTLDLASEAFTQGARGFIGFDTIITENKIKIVEANYRTTGSTVPKITVDKATDFSGDYEWLYLSSFYYNEKVKNVSEMIKVLKELGVLFEKNNEKKINCIITFGEREKRCGLCFFWKKDSFSLDTINLNLNKILSGISANIKIGL